jgi:hypothetical protein
MFLDTLLLVEGMHNPGQDAALVMPAVLDDAEVD